MVATVWVLTIYRRVGISLPPPLVSQGKLAGSCPRDYCPPCFPPFLALALFLPILTFNQRNYEQKWTLKLNFHSNIPLRRQSFKTSIFPSGVVPGHQPACLPNKSQQQQRERQWQRAYRRRPLTALETPGKNDRDRSTFITDNSLRVPSYRVVDSRQKLDASQSN